MTKKVQDHFKKSDPILHSIALQVGIFSLSKTDDYYVYLCESIISQQLSIKAADTIFARFKKLHSPNKITPKKTLKLDDVKIREAGISFQKIRYIKDLADKIESKQLIFDSIHEMSDEEVIDHLTMVKGIGKWTAEMFLMSALGRPDIFSYGDLGIRKAIMRIYNLKTHPTYEEAEKLSKKWSPYRTFACKILWKSLEIKD